VFKILRDGCQPTFLPDTSHNTISYAGQMFREWLSQGRTSISKSSSILTAFPKRKMYCIRLANSHMLLNSFSVLAVSGAMVCSVGGSASSSALRLRRGIFELSRGGREDWRVNAVGEKSTRSRVCMDSDKQ
jgi:hypothetical protein